jgi:sugar phosphate isomerase/epimerase
MFKVLDVNLLRIPGSLRELAPLAVRHGFQGISVPREILDDPAKAVEAGIIVRDHGLRWGLLHTPVDFFSEDVEGDVLEEGLRKQEEWAAVGEKLGVRYSYNHIWPSNSQRQFAANFEWHVTRLERVQAVFDRHGIHYGLEFLGPHELRTRQRYPFVHTIAGVLAIANAAGGRAGFLFDVYHWYCGSRRLDDLYYAAHNHMRMVNVHLNDGVAGRAPDEQRDMEREMPMATGIIDTAMIYRMFQSSGYSGPVMCEPMRPTTERFGGAPAEQSIAEVAAAFRRVETPSG